VSAATPRSNECDPPRRRDRQVLRTPRNQSHRHAIRETGRAKINALVFVGDAMEEKADRLCHLAGQLGSLNVAIFLFQEGILPDVELTFRSMATLSKGAYLRFDLANIARLKELLGAVASFAAGGYGALESYCAGKSAEVLRLTAQLRR
jgi:hypothetical protein